MSSWPQQLKQLWVFRRRCARSICVTSILFFFQANIVSDEGNTKVRLKLAICPGSWLMPAWIVINTEITVCYNNQLKQAGVGMKLGIDNVVNTSTKGSGPSPYGRMKIKDKPAKQPSIKPDSQGSNKQKRASGPNSCTVNAGCPNSCRANAGCPNTI